MLPGVEAKQKKLMLESRAFPKEVRAQFEFLPQIKRFALECGGVKSLDNLTPEIVYGSFDEDGSGIIVLMDLNDKGRYSNETMETQDVCLKLGSQIDLSNETVVSYRNME